MVVKLRLEITDFAVNVRGCKLSGHHTILDQCVNMLFAISSHTVEEAHITL